MVATENCIFFIMLVLLIEKLTNIDAIFAVCAVQPQVPGSFKSAAPEPIDPSSYMFRPESSSMLMTSPTTPAAAVAAPWTNNVQTISFTPLPKGFTLIFKQSVLLSLCDLLFQFLLNVVMDTAGAGANNNCSSSSENTPKPRSNRDTTEQANPGHSLRGKALLHISPIYLLLTVSY